MNMSYEWLEQVTKIRAELAASHPDPDALTIATTVSQELPLLGASRKLEIFDEVATHINGLGPLESLSHKKGITDIVVNGPEDVWFDAGEGMQRANISWTGEDQLREYVVHLVGQLNRRLDDAQPYVDARLPSGIRLHAIIPPLSQNGTCLSLRIPQKQTLSLTDLQNRGMFNAQLGEILEQIISGGLSFLISGGTGTGKTTLLAALLSGISERERIVVIEDLYELVINHPHVVSLQARGTNTEGFGEVPLRVLTRQALRMRPDRLILGEVRGAEIIDLFTALNTGHTGGCATVHANSAQDVPSRIVGLGLLAGLPSAAIHSLFATAVSLIVELTRTKDGLRKVTSLHLIQLESGSVRTRLLLDAADSKSFEVAQQEIALLVSKAA
jgi:pilus assembly protein CpaF